MPDRPAAGGGSASSLEFNWTPVGQQQRPADNTTQWPSPTDTTRWPQQPTDQSARPGQQGVIELSYNDPNFDRKLWSGNYTTLRIKDYPQGVRVNSWVDDNGFFFWYNGGNDNRRPHYIPPGLKNIEINGFTQNVDDLRIQASMASVRESDRAQMGFTSLNQLSSPLEFAQRMGSLGAQELQRQEKFLRQAADQSPDNPYFRIYLSDVLLAEAFKPIMDQVNSGQSRIDLNTPYTQQKLAEAMQESQRAAQVAQRGGNLRYPNMSTMPGLFPFFGWGNPDAYWGGALYQAYQRQVGIMMLQQYTQRFGNGLELPPALPPKDLRSP